MHRTRIAPRRLILVAALGAALTAAGPAAAAPSVTQQFTLQPGWNAVWLEVQPEPRDSATVFSGLPVESVWCWVPPPTAVEFIQNPGEGLWNSPGWLAFFPAQAPGLSTLNAVQANRPYLIKLGGTEAVLWSVTGRPSAVPLRWRADSFNLVGLPVQDDGAVSFARFFAGSPAHAGQAVYRLGGTGVWEFVDDPDATHARRGEAYWVWCAGGSLYQGPLEVAAPGDGLDYGSLLTEHVVALGNVAGSAKTVTLEVLSPAESTVMVQKVYDETTGLVTWPALPRSISLEAGQTRRVTLAIRRELLAGAPYEAVLRVGEDLGGATGIKFLLPVSGE